MSTQRKEYDHPPGEFIAAINDRLPDFDFRGWRQSPEWRMFVAGYNAAVIAANKATMKRYNMGETAERLFGVTQ